MKKLIDALIFAILWMLFPLFIVLVGKETGLAAVFITSPFIITAGITAYKESLEE